MHSWVHCFALCLCLLASCVSAERLDAVYVCEAGDESFLGKYEAKQAAAGVAVAFVNANDRGIFRHAGFWYMGDVSDWPPVTHYRCVLDERCLVPGDSEIPPLEGYQPTQRNGVHPPPIVTLQPCSGGTSQQQEL